jgi:hypothetical protein
MLIGLRFWVLNPNFLRIVNSLKVGKFTDLLEFVFILPFITIIFEVNVRERVVLTNLNMLIFFALEHPRYFMLKDLCCVMVDKIDQL